MQNRYRRTGLVLVVLVGCFAAIVTAAPKVSDDGRIVKGFDNGWRFVRGDVRGADNSGPTAQQSPPTAPISAMWRSG